MDKRFIATDDSARHHSGLGIMHTYIYNNSSHEWLYNQSLYTTVAAKPVPPSFFGLFDYNYTALVRDLSICFARNTHCCIFCGGLN